MTAYAGSALLHALFADNPNASDNVRVGNGLDLTFRALVISSILSTGAPGFFEPIDIEHANAADVDAAYLPGPGDQIFERIHVIPPLSTIPFILSNQHVFVEVWNAFRETPQHLILVTPSGPVGVTIVSGGLSDVDFAPLESKIYDILISATGAPLADNTIDFDFGGTPSPDFYVSGLRLLPFTISPDWDAGVDEVITFLTDVMQSYDQTEQRMQLREIPSRSIKYNAVALDPKENDLMMALLYTWQGRSYGVLLWQRAARLGFVASAGDRDIVVDTTFMNIQPGDSVILITDAFNWFATTVESMTDASMRLASAVDRNFPASGTLVTPVVLGRVADSITVARPTNASGAIAIVFELEVVIPSDSAAVALV